MQDLVEYVLENWQTLTWKGMLVFIVIRLLPRYLWKALRPRVVELLHLNDEVKEYVSNQKMIDKKIDLILERMGIEWDAAKFHMKPYPSNGKTSYTSPWAALFIAHFARIRTIFNIKRGMKNMQKLKSRKFALAVVAAVLVILNDGLELGVDSNTVMSFAAIVVGYIFAEAHVDGKKVQPVEKPLDDSEFIG
jgi:hypothetical protein